jgi:hypothetical protein
MLLHSGSRCAVDPAHYGYCANHSRRDGPGLESGKKKDFEDFVRANANDIVEKWTDHFVKKKHIAPKIVTQRVGNVRTIG